MFEAQFWKLLRNSEAQPKFTLSYKKINVYFKSHKRSIYSVLQYIIICRKAYSRMTMLSKLKYVGVRIEDLVDIYILYIRSLTEYCSVAFHSSLTVEQSNRLERIQKTCLKVILKDMYIDYPAALEMTGLETLADRRLKRCLNFSLKSIRHERNTQMFPLNKTAGIFNTRHSEIFSVNFAATTAYRESAIPFCQRLLNKEFKNK